MSHLQWTTTINCRGIFFHLHILIRFTIYDYNNFIGLLENPGGADSIRATTQILEPKITTELFIEYS